MILAIGSQSALYFVPAGFVLAVFVLTVFVLAVLIPAIFVLAAFVLAVFVLIGLQDNETTVGPPVAETEFQSGRLNGRRHIALRAHAHKKTSHETTRQSGPFSA